jgi:transcriptional regulator with XRE-family HTH domain
MARRIAPLRNPFRPEPAEPDNRRPIRPADDQSVHNHADDERVGRLLILLRRRLRMRQRTLSGLAGVPRDDVLRVEAGRAGSVRLERLRRIFEAAGARGRFTVWWNGAAADRLLDERHAALVERAVSVFQRRGWTTAVEASYSEYGERGSIDILAGHPRFRAIAVSEVKSGIGSSEEMHRVLDAKERLAPKLAKQRFGWVPEAVGRILILPDELAMRRAVDRHGATMTSTYPARGRQIRAWIRRPDGPLRGIWFLSEVANGDRET